MIPHKAPHALFLLILLVVGPLVTFVSFLAEAGMYATPVISTMLLVFGPIGTALAWMLSSMQATRRNARIREQQWRRFQQSGQQWPQQPGPAGQWPGYGTR